MNGPEKKISFVSFIYEKKLVMTNKVSLFSLCMYEIIIENKNMNFYENDTVGRKKEILESSNTESPPLTHSDA